MSLFSRPRRDLLPVVVAALWLVAAVGAAWRDWPTPKSLSEERLRFAMLVANAVDKDFRPYDTPLRADMDAQYQQLVADFTARFGDRFDVGLVEKRHATALADMPVERGRIVAFAVLSTAVVWWLLWRIRGLLTTGHRPGLPS